MKAIENWMHKGKAGLFSGIESKANLRNVNVFTMLAAILLGLSVLLYFTVEEIAAVPVFMIFSAVLLAAAIAEAIVVHKKNGVGNRLKWVIGVSFIAAAIVTTSTLGVHGVILFVFPMLLSIGYCSFLYSLFISALTVMGTFVPLLLASYMSYYDMNVIKLFPGSVIQITSTLEQSLPAGSVDAVGTKVNELLSVFLPVILFVLVIAVVSTRMASTIRKQLLEQYHQFQTTRE